jgi:hypothetical protein
MSTDRGPASAWRSIAEQARRSWEENGARRERLACARVVLANVPNWPESPQVQLLLRRIAEDIMARG